MNKTEIYIVKISTGSHDDYYESDEFACFDKEKAQIWVDRFNKIIDNNRIRINKFHSDPAMYESDQPFWHDFIKYEEPNAVWTKVDIKDNNFIFLTPNKK
jgi:hypothetical protein